ncbi:MAG: magnesium/cobalt transporter CorA [Spirochaetes bacterium]|nr:magnesium/cobalt transporter CorA [Spirochaetota bacterium]
MFNFNPLIKKVNPSPGMPVHTGEKKVEEIKVSIIRYDNKTLNEKIITITEKNRKQSIDNIYNSSLVKNKRKKSQVLWINIKGLHDAEFINEIGSRFEIHNLTIEDILNTAHRPKVEDFDKYLFIAMKSLSLGKSGGIASEQLSIVLKSDIILSFQEGGEKLFTALRNRIDNVKGRIRKRGGDYLSYAIIDTIIDRYFFIFNKIAEQMEDIEKELLENPSHETLKKIQELKNYSLIMRKSIWPVRDMMRYLIYEDLPIIKEINIPFFRDVNDHVVHIIDIIESVKEMLTGMHDMYLSSISNKMNEIMKVLTIIATIFIPLTFVAGIYGMNFKFMPELEWKWGYFASLGFMLILAGIMLIFFKRKKWL